jgi:membrane protease YdiL (CAAX protease family)
MQIADFLLLAVLVVLFPAWEFWHGPIHRAKLQADASLKIASYRTTCIQLWTLALSMLVLYGSGVLSIDALTVRQAPAVAEPIVAAALVLVTLYLAWSLRTVARDSAVRQQTAESMQPLAWMLPTDRREAVWFVGPVSLSAGICEELLYRGYLMQWLDGFMPIWAAMLLSSMVFGLMHAYQGPAGILRTAGLGLVMAGLFVATGSLLWPIALHVIIDVYAGALSWFALRRSESIQVPQAQ